MTNTYFNQKYVAYGFVKHEGKKKMQYSNDLSLKFFKFLLKNENLKVCKTNLFNLQKNCLSASKPEWKMLNGLIKLVFIPDELATSKVTDKRKRGLKPLDQRKCSIVRGLYFISCSLYTCTVWKICRCCLLLFCFAFLFFLHIFSLLKYRLLLYKMHSAKK